jgi:hypothetical protein
MLRSCLSEVFNKGLKLTLPISNIAIRDRVDCWLTGRILKIRLTGFYLLTSVRRCKQVCFMHTKMHGGNKFLSREIKTSNCTQNSGPSIYLNWVRISAPFPIKKNNLFSHFTSKKFPTRQPLKFMGKKPKEINQQKT